MPEHQRQLPITTPIADVSVRTEWYLKSKIESPASLVDPARMARATVASRVSRTQIRLSSHRGKSDHFLRTYLLPRPLSHFPMQQSSSFQDFCFFPSESNLATLGAAVWRCSQALLIISRLQLAVPWHKFSRVLEGQFPGPGRVADGDKERVSHS